MPSSVCVLSVTELLLQRIVGENSQNSVLVFILQNVTGGRRRSWFFCHTEQYGVEGQAACSLRDNTQGITPVPINEGDSD